MKPFLKHIKISLKYSARSVLLALYRKLDGTDVQVIQPGKALDLRSLVKVDPDGTPFLPCRCGEEHRGDYFQEDWLHHNCYHRGSIVVRESDLSGDRDDLDAICMDCGKLFHLEVTHRRS